MKKTLLHTSEENDDGIDTLLEKGCSQEELTQHILHSIQHEQKAQIPFILEKYAYAFGLRIQELPLLTEPLPNKKPSPRKTGQMAVVNGFAYIDYLRTFFRMIHEGTPRSRSRNVAEYTMAQDLLRYIGIEPSKHP